VIPTAPPFDSLRFRLLPWCVRGDWAPNVSSAHRGRALPRPPAAIMVIRKLLDDEDPHSAGSPPFVPEPDTRACSPPFLSSAPASALPFVLVRGRNYAAASSGRSQLHRRRPSATAMAPTGDERERPRPPSPASPPVPM
jgi:hypothetical protein